jgi:hypothetical protein
VSGPLSKLTTFASLTLSLALGALWITSYFTGLIFLYNAEQFTIDRSAINEERHVWTRWYVGVGRGGVGIARILSDGPGATLRLHGYDKMPPARLSFTTRRPPRHPADAWSAAAPTLLPPSATPTATSRTGWQWRRGPFLAHHERRPGFWSSDMADNGVYNGPVIWKTETDNAVAFPIAIPTLLFALPSLRLLLRHRRRNRWLTQGRCGTCGYDIRATPARCPECGASQLKQDRGKHRGPNRPTPEDPLAMNVPPSL